MSDLDEILEGWEKIRVEAGLSDRQLRRLAKKGDFPIHHKSEAPKSPVFAFRRDIIAWKKQREQQESQVPESVPTPPPTPSWKNYLFPASALVMAILSWTLIPKYKVKPYLATYTWTGNQLILINQHGNTEKKIPIRMFDEDGVAWMPFLEDEPAFLLLIGENRVAIHERRSSKIWDLEPPWIHDSPAIAFKIMRVKTHAYDGIGVFWRHPDGTSLQIYNRRKERIGELFSVNKLNDLILTNRWITLCFESQPSQQLNIWSFLSKKYMVIDERLEAREPRR